MLEHFAGDFPLWLAPEQVRIVPIADRHNDYVLRLRDKLFDAGLRAEVDRRSERMNAKVRDAELYKVPYTVIVGDKEMEAGAVSFRSRKEGEQKGIAARVFVQHLQAHVTGRALEVVPLSHLETA